MATHFAMAGIIMSTSSGGFKLPPHTTRTLPNGVRLYVMEYHELPLVDLGVIICDGGAQDSKGKEWLASLASDTLRNGTATRSPRDVADAVDFVGGSLTASADQDGSHIGAEFLIKDLDLGLDLVADTLMRPAFAQEEVDRA